MVGGSLMVHKGDVIYVTNTKCRIFLDHVDIKQEEAQKALIRVSGNSASRGWGKAGVNGGDAVITTKDQTLSGRIVTDTISKLDLTLGREALLRVRPKLKKIVRRQKRTAPFL